MATLERPYLRLHRNPEPLASYLRPLERDYRHIAELISAGFSLGSGIIVDACHPERSEDLRTFAAQHGLESVLDPRSVDLATDGGIRRAGVAELPWSRGVPDHPEAFGADRVESYIEALAATALELGSSAVLAPTHYLDDPLSRWLEIDLALVRRLRAKLDSDSRGRGTRIYYPVATSLATLRVEPFGARLMQGLGALAAERAIDALWLRVNNFGTKSAGPLTLPRYIALARQLHSLGMPIVAERTGTVGLALLALGAIVGIESGVTHGERFNIRDLTAPPEPSSGGFVPRVYLPSIGVFLKREEAAALLNTRGMRGSFGCQERCCPRGVPDMLADARRHFVVTRAAEVHGLAAVPQSMRVEHYFAKWLRSAADRATRAAMVIPALDKDRRRLDMWRATISAQVERDMADPPTMSPPLEAASHRPMGLAGGS